MNWYIKTSSSEYPSSPSCLGWLDPDGKYLLLEKGETHEEYAIRQGLKKKDASKALLDEGWARIAPYGPESVIATISGEQLSGMQLLTLKDLAANNHKVRILIHNGTFPKVLWEDSSIIEASVKHINKTAYVQSMMGYWIGPDGKFNVLGDGESHVDAIPRMAKQYGIKSNRFTKRQVIQDEDEVFEDFLRAGFVRFFNGYTSIVVSKAEGSLTEAQISGIMDQARPNVSFYIATGKDGPPIDTEDKDTIRSVLMGNQPSSMEVGIHRMASIVKKAQEDDEYDLLREVMPEAIAEFQETEKQERIKQNLSELPTIIPFDPKTGEISRNISSLCKAYELKVVSIAPNSDRSGVWIHLIEKDPLAKKECRALEAHLNKLPGVAGAYLRTINQDDVWIEIFPTKTNNKKIKTAQSDDLKGSYQQR